MTLDITADRNGSAPAATPAHSLSAPSSVRGMTMLVASTVFFAGSDAVTKLLSAGLPTGEIVWLRYLTFAVLTLALVARHGGTALLRSRNAGLQILRGVALLGSTIAFTTALRFLPVADATAIYFISPFLIMALSIVFLGETVGWRRWTAAGIGLVGVLIVIRPGTGAFQTAAVLPLVGAACWASAAIVTRKMSGGDSALTTLAYSAMVGLVGMSFALPFVWVTPSLSEVLLGAGIGVLSAIGHWFVIQAYRYANASTIAPFAYVQMIWAGLLGYLVFSALPDTWTVVGAGIIAASGLYTAYRERVRALQARATA